MFRFGYFDSDIIGVDDEGMPIFDRAELSDLFALFFASLVSDGVLALPNTCFKIVAAGNGLDIERMPGFGMVKGHFCYDDESDFMTLTAPQKYNRIDRVIMRLNLLDRMVEIIIKQGEEAEKPKPPELIRPSAGDYFELCLAEITLAPKQTVITQSGINDTRANSALCGFITQLIDHLDTAVFFDQFNSFYNEFVLKSDRSYDEFLAWAEEKKAEIVKWQGGKEAEFDAWQTVKTKEFDELVQIFVEKWESWFQNIRDQLSEDAAGNLQNEVNSITAVLREISEEEIDAIIDGTYEEDEEGGLEPDVYSRISDEEIEDIVNNAFQ